MGELEKSLKDAEDSLQGDPTFCKVTVGVKNSNLLLPLPLSAAPAGWKW